MSEDVEINKKIKINEEKLFEIQSGIENVIKSDIVVGSSKEFESNQFQELDNTAIKLKKEAKLEYYISNQQTYTMDPTLHNELLQLEDISTESENVVDDCFSNVLKTESETCKNSTGDICTDFEETNSEVTSNVFNPMDKEIINNQLIVLEPNNPVMVRFQNTLKQHLLKQKDKIKQELLTLNGLIRTKQNEKFSFINEINNVIFRVKTQQSFLSQFHKMKMELKTTNEQLETCINQGKQRCTEITTKIAVESKKCSNLKAQLDSTEGLLKELSKYEKEQEITFNMCNQKKSQAKHYKKKLLNEQQKQDLLLLSLTQEILRLEDRMKQLGEQAETKYNERELLKQKIVDNSTDLDAINGDNTKITLLWNEVLIVIQQRDKSFQKIKNDFHEAKNKYHTLLIEANSYKRSAHEETRKNYEFLNLLNKLKQEKNHLQNSFKAFLDKFSYLKDEQSKLIQITEFQLKNLDQVIFDQKALKNELNSSLNLSDKISNQKSKYEEDILDELKKQLVANNFCVQINNKISEIKVQNKENEFILVGAENNLSHALLKLEQYRSTISNIEKDLEENIKNLNNQGYALSGLDFELKKLYTEIQNKSRQIDLENKQLETVKKKYDEGYIITPQMQIDHTKCKIEEVEKEIDLIKQSWIQKQKKNVQLLDQRNKQFNDLSKMHKYVSVMETKGIKLEQEIIFLSKDIDQYKRTLTNMRNTILKLNANFNHNKGKSIQFFNENEWIQCTYLAELKENEKQCLEYMDQLKLLKNELNELQNVYIEKQCESKSWDTKVRLLVEMKKEMKNKEGDLGDINAMKNEIHRMQIRESQLKKTLEKIMLDLEVCISRREMIYNKVAAKDIRLKGKNEMKQTFLKKLDNLRINIKKIKIECKKLDRNINDLENNKMEFQKKIVVLNNRLIKVQKNIDDSIKNIEDISAAKIKNIHNLCYKQKHAKFLDEVKKGKYHLLVKSELKMDEEFSVEWKKNADVISVVEALKNDFPYLDFQIARLMYTLKSIDS